MAALAGAVRAVPELTRTARPELRTAPDGVHLHAGASLQPPTVDPVGRGRTITGGAALRNVELTMTHLGHRPLTTLLPDPDDPLHLATVRTATVPAGSRVAFDALDPASSFEPTEPPEPPLEPADPHDRRLYLAMLGDAGQVGPFSARQLTPPLARRLYAAARPPGVTATTVTGSLLRTVGTVLAAAAHRRQVDEDHLADIDRLLSERSSPAGAGAAPGAALAEQHGRGRLRLIATPTDTPTDWVRAGWALQNARLTAADNGLMASVVGGVLDAPGVRATLADRFRLDNCPQLLVRIGWARALRPGEHRQSRGRPVEVGGPPLP